MIVADEPTASLDHTHVRDRASHPSQPDGARSYRHRVDARQPTDPTRRPARGAAAARAPDCWWTTRRRALLRRRCDLRARVGRRPHLRDRRGHCRDRAAAIRRRGDAPRSACRPATNSVRWDRCSTCPARLRPAQHRRLTSSGYSVDAFRAKIWRRALDGDGRAQLRSRVVTVGASRWSARGPRSNGSPRPGHGGHTAAVIRHVRRASSSWRRATKTRTCSSSSRAASSSPPCRRRRSSCTVVSKRGDFFGEMSLLESQPRVADVVAVEPTVPAWSWVPAALLASHTP